MTTTNNLTTDASVNKLALDILSLNLISNKYSTYGEAKANLTLNGFTYVLDITIREKHVSYTERKTAEEQGIIIPDKVYEAVCINESSKREEALKLIGLTFNYTEIISRYESLVNDKVAEDKQKQIDSINSYYDSLKVDTYMNHLTNHTAYISTLRMTKEEYIKQGIARPVTILIQSVRKVHHTKLGRVSFNSTVEVNLTIFSTKIELQQANRYDRKDIRYAKRNTSKTETVTSSLVFDKLENMLNELHNENLYKAQGAYDRKKLVEATSAKLKYNVTEFNSGYFDHYSSNRKWISTTNKAFVVKKDSVKKECVAVHFDVSSDGEVYNIRNIYANLSKDAVKKILDILNDEAQMVYNSDLSK